MKTRYRIQRIKHGLLSSRDVLVLQVMKPVMRMSMDSIEHVDTWVDASVEDLTEATGGAVAATAPNIVPIGWRYRAVGNTTGWTYCPDRPPKVWGGVELIIERVYADRNTTDQENACEQQTVESAVPVA